MGSADAMPVVHILAMEATGLDWLSLSVIAVEP